MSDNAFDLADTIIPRSDQVNADDLMAGPRTITITKVTRGNTEQPVNIVTAEFGDGRPYKPSKSMRRVLVAAWGKDATVYAGRRLTIYRDPTITFGKEAVGGIRISAMSHIDHPITLALTVTRGRRQPYTVEPLAVSYKPIPASFADKIKAGNLTDDDQAKALDYLAKLTEADPAEVAELRELLGEVPVEVQE